MCSISTSTNDKPKKRKHLDDDGETQQENSNKKQVTSVPTTDSLSNLLVQGLQSSDENLINNVLCKKENVVESTINNLPNTYVEPLFNYLQKCLYEQGENLNYVICLRKLFQYKISQILNIPNIRNNLIMLSDNLDLRCDLLDRCYKLKGRLDLMFLMLNKEEKSINEENIVIYEESSSEQEDEEDDDLVRMMNSDDEDNDLNNNDSDGDEEMNGDLEEKNGTDEDNDDDLMDEEEE